MIKKLLKVFKNIYVRLFVSKEKTALKAAEDMNILIERSLKYMEETCPKFFASKDETFFVCFDIPNSEYMAVIKITKNYSGEKKRRVVVGVMKEGTDKIVENYLRAMDDEEVVEYLRKPETKAELFEIITRLNEKAPDSLDF